MQPRKAIVSVLDKDVPDLEESNFEEVELPILLQEFGGPLENEGAISPLPLPVKRPGSIKPGPLPKLPPSLKEWKASGKRGTPPVAYEMVIKDAPNHALEYELYHGFKLFVTYREVEQRIGELENQQNQKSHSQRYTRATIYYLQKKLEEFVVGK